MNFRIVEREMLLAMQSIENHTVISLEDLKREISRNLPVEESFSLLARRLFDEGFVKQAEQGITLTESGLQWYLSHGAELSVEFEETSEASGVPKEPYDVAKLNMETRNLSVFQTLRKIDLQQINLSPDFQRAFVWDEVRQSRLIESILIRIPLPAFYIDATDQVAWNVVDGLQRLTTLYNYCRRSSFRLHGLQFLRELEGKSFDELPPKYKVLIEDDTQLLFYNLMPGTPAQAKFTIFSRVNTGGLQLTAQEIRHALNQGPIAGILASISEDNIFRTVTKGVVESLRMSDRELILRSLSFMYFDYEKYREFNELDAFLVHSMAELNKASEIQLEKLRSGFLGNLEKAEIIFGRYAFRKFYAVNGRRSPFNKALFEVWSSSLSPYSVEILEKKKDEIINNFIELINTSESFSRAISSSTSSYSAVSTRFSVVRQLLENITK